MRPLQDQCEPTAYEDLERIAIEQEAEERRKTERLVRLYMGYEQGVRFTSQKRLAD